MTVAPLPAPSAADGATGEAGDEALDGILRRHLSGYSLVKQERLNGGSSARATQVVLKGTSGETLRVVVRRPTYAEPLAAVRREYAVLERCAAAGVPVPAARVVDDVAGAIVLDFVSGAPDFHPADTNHMLQQMAEQLARIHRVPLDSGLGFLSHRSDGAARQVAFRSEQPDTNLGEAALRSTLSELWPWPQHNPDVLLHGDYWPGNVLYEAGRLVAVLDWEESERGDPLADVALTRLDLLWAFGDEAAEAFTEHYRSLTDLDWSNLARWELCIALRPLGQLPRWASSYVGAPISRPDITVEWMAEGHRRFVAAALAKLAASP